MENRVNIPQAPDAAPGAPAPQAFPASPAAPPPLDVILASGSPRRSRLLEQAGIAFTVRPSEIDEALEPELLADPPEAAKKLAERKAGAVVQEVLAENYSGLALILGADTMVVCDGEIFGKPRSLSDGKRMLRRLSGRTHQVMTAVSAWMIAAPTAQDVSVGFRSFVDTTDVTFRPLSDDEIADYLRQGESFDKAGAYAIQGEGAKLVDHIDGELDTVIGLPVQRLLQEFPELRPEQD